ncbi:hypothetical protein [Anditalea andensis]|uniref:Uncharacterized protein n=1 Tax=Anditalea andensis TaxID=1048983 RepID=A0A074KW09_9BACT|nr:hypothetical protein [Anditalea andensis]KEO72445.1 hypothetical protein EL17_17030 [Anditalea andensis]
MKRALIILLSIGISHFSYGQMTQPTYRTTNGVPDAAGFKVTLPTPNGGLLIFPDKKGNPSASAMKIREYQPDNMTGMVSTPSSNLPSEIYFSPELLPSPRTTAQWIAPIPLKDRTMEWEKAIEPAYHLMPFNLSPAINQNPIFEDYRSHEFYPRRKD